MPFTNPPWNIVTIIRPHNMPQLFSGFVALPVKRFGNTIKCGLLQFKHSKIHFFRSLNPYVKGNRRIYLQWLTRIPCLRGSEPVLLHKRFCEGIGAIIAVFHRGINHLDV